MAVAPDALGQSFIKRDGIGQHPRAGIRNFEHFKQRWRLCLTGIAPQAFGDIEADVGFDLFQGVGQIGVCRDEDGLMSVGFDGCPDVVNRFDVVEIRAGVRRHIRRKGFIVLLDVGQNGYLPLTRRSRCGTGRLFGIFFLKRWSHVSPQEDLFFSGRKYKTI
jgi:hypothetical protein